MNDLRRMLVVVTATEECVKLVQDAFGLAERFGATVFLLDVVHDPFAYTGGICRCRRSRKSIGSSSKGFENGFG